MATTRDSGSCEITEAELISMPWYLNSEQSVLSLLQDKGAPVLGKIYFKWNWAYEQTHTKDILTGSLLVSWRKIK